MISNGNHDHFCIITERINDGNMFVNFYKDTKTGYNFHGQNHAWKSELEFQAWLRTFRAQVVNGYKDQVIVWYWKEKQIHVSPEQYENIDGIEDTTLCNGCRKCKRIYDERNCIVNTYFVWYWEDDSISNFYERLEIQNKIREERYSLPFTHKENEHALKEIKEGLIKEIDITKFFELCYKD